MLWRDCAMARARLSLRCEKMQSVQKSHELSFSSYLSPIVWRQLTELYQDCAYARARPSL